MILSAGLGTRMYSITNDKIPKPLLMIEDKPLLQYSIELYKKHGITEIAINLHKYPEQIKEYFGDGSKFGVKIHYSYEPELLGTGGGIKKVEDFFGNETFIVCNADYITNIDLSKVIAFHKEKGATATLCVIKSYKRQFELGEDNRVLKYVEDQTPEELAKLNTQEKYTFAGFYVLEPEALQFLPKDKFSDSAKDLFQSILKNNMKMYAFMIDDYFWRTVGNSEQYNQVKKEIKDKA